MSLPKNKCCCCFLERCPGGSNAVGFFDRYSSRFHGPESLSKDCTNFTPGVATLGCDKKTPETLVVRPYPTLGWLRQENTRDGDPSGVRHLDCTSVGTPKTGGVQTHFGSDTDRPSPLTDLGLLPPPPDRPHPSP